MDQRLFSDGEGSKESQQKLHQECLKDIHVRCAEIHTAREGQSLNNPGHFDSGSVVTVDILLSGEFEGRGVTMGREKIDFQVGDALISRGTNTIRLENYRRRARVLSHRVLEW